MDVNLGGREKLPIKQFKLEEMVKDPAIVMIAKRGSGKSWICRAILKQLKDIPAGIIIAPTDRMSCFYGTFFPDSYIFYDYKSEIIKSLLYRQEQMIDKRTEYKKKGKYVDTRAFIIMDDCLSKKGSWMKDQPITELLFNGRHYHVTYILTMQYPLGITPDLRGNFDYIFLMKDNFQSNIKRMYDHYAGMFPTFDSFKQVFGQLVVDYGAMVVVNRFNKADDSSSFLNQIKYYKAPVIEDVKIGCRQFRMFHEKNYDKNWRKRQRAFDIAEFCLNKKKDKSVLNVELEKNEKSDAKGKLKFEKFNR